MKKSLFKTSVLCAALMVGISAFAVPSDPNVNGSITPGYLPPNVGGYDSGSIDNSNFIRNQRYQAKTRYEATKDPAIVEEEVRQKMDLLNTEQVSFKLKNIKISGNTAFPTYVLMRLVDFKIGQDVTINDLIMSANDITDYYQAKGYISTVAYLPPQKVQNGSVEIKILEGKYGNVEINPGRWERSSYLNKKYLEDNNIKPGSVLNVKDVRNALTDMSTEEYMKGAVSFADNEDSEEFSDVTLDVKDRFPINFDLRYDNQGREAIGTQRGVLYAGLHDVTGHGDTLMGTVAYSSRSIGAGGVYSIPIAENDTRLNLGYSYSHVKLGKLLKEYDISGDSHDIFVGVSRRLARGEDYRLYGDITLDFRNTDLSSGFPGLDKSLNDYRSRVLRGSLTDIKDDFYGRWLFNGGIAGGIPLDASDQHTTRWKSSNNFIKANASAARLQVLPFGHLAILQVNGQYANRHLWASEAMQVGGIASVRGYEEGFRIGDYGVTASAEYRMPIPGFRAILPEKYKFIADSIQIAGFYDFGWFGDRFARDLYGNKIHGDYLMSAGPGLVVKLTKYISANLYWGFPIGKTHDDYAGRKYKDDCRFHFTVTSNIL